MECAIILPVLLANRWRIPNGDPFGIAKFAYLPFPSFSLFFNLPFPFHSIQAEGKVANPSLREAQGF